MSYSELLMNVFETESEFNDSFKDMLQCQMKYQELCAMGHFTIQHLLAKKQLFKLNQDTLKRQKITKKFNFTKKKIIKFNDLYMTVSQQLEYEFDLRIRKYSELETKKLHLAICENKFKLAKKALSIYSEESKPTVNTVKKNSSSQKYDVKGLNDFVGRKTEPNRLFSNTNMKNQDQKQQKSCCTIM
ncbi:MAG: hypothetical protein P4M12_05605 [Gammaproteobacteria bacterium]|nr:hypothetical protein [Gammaproteobacteria bacterium]